MKCVTEPIKSSIVKKKTFKKLSFQTQKGTEWKSVSVTVVLQALKTRW